MVTAFSLIGESDLDLKENCC